MILAHVGGLHLGYRAYHRSERGRNARERDAARAFQAALEELIRARPRVVVFSGNIFHQPNPPASALVTLTRGLEQLRSALPGTSILLTAGFRDTPIDPREPGILPAIETLPQVYTASTARRTIGLGDGELCVLMVPHAAVQLPDGVLEADASARWNVLAIHAEVGGNPDVPLAIDAEAWDYVAVGGASEPHQLAPNVRAAGALERTEDEPWGLALDERGFILVDLERATSRFVAVPGRPVVRLAPLRVKPDDPTSINGRIQELVEGVPGGIDAKLVRLTLEGVGLPEHVIFDSDLLADLRRRALHLELIVQGRVSARDPVELGITGLLEDLDGEGEGRGKGRGQGDGQGKGKGRRLAEALRNGASLPWRLPDMESVKVAGHPILGTFETPLGRGLQGWTVGDLEWRTALRDGLAGSLFPDPVAASAEETASFTVTFGEGDGAPPFSPGEGKLLTLGSGPRDPSAYLELAMGSLARLDGAAMSGALVRALGDPARESQESVRDVEQARDTPAAAETSDLGAGPTAPHVVETAERELRELRADGAEATGDLEVRSMEWLRERQDAETQLQAYRDRARELKARLNQLEGAGSGAPCPSCGRTLNQEFEGVIEQLRDEWESVVQDGRWWKRRREQLELMPEDLQELDGRAVRIKAAVEAAAERLEHLRGGLRGAHPAAPPAGAAADDDARSVPGATAALRKPVPEGDPSVMTIVSELTEEERSALADSARRYHEALLTRMREALLVRAGMLLNRISSGALSGLVEQDGRVRLARDGVLETPRREGDRAAARLALRIAALDFCEASDRCPGCLIFGEDIELLEEGGRARAWALLHARTDRLSQMLVVVGEETAAIRPEFFDGLRQTHIRPGEEVSIRSLIAGHARVGLKAAGQRPSNVQVSARSR